MKKKQKPVKKSRPAAKPRVQNERLKGWKEMASFLGQPVAVSQRWARSGTPVTREDGFMYASRDGLSRHLGREAGLELPVHIATANMDLYRPETGTLLRAQWEHGKKAKVRLRSRKPVH